MRRKDKINMSSDAIPSTRVSLGTVLLPSVFGLKIKVVEDSLPWIASHLDKRELSNMEIDHLIPIEEKGLILFYSSDNEDKFERTMKTWESLHEIHFDED